jgi:hypothetical protein
MFLVLDHEDESFRGKSQFSSRKSRVFWNEKERFEIDDFAILSLARLPISPPWQLSTAQITSGSLRSHSIAAITLNGSQCSHWTI